ncbi:MAG: c-type cytochrome [Pseudomonadota bacterium]|nr:c-type cytochrome [Pseudomonadota bacterium]
MSGTHRIGRLLALVVGFVAGLAVCVIVAVWALARPGADPVTTAAYTFVDRASEYWDSVFPDKDDAAPDWNALAFEVAGGDPETGARLIAEYGCGACHTIPGIARARGRVGPNLTGFRDQAYIAGVLPNRPGDLVDWLQSPPRHAPETVMPDMGISEAEADDMAAYLYTLEGR